MHGVDCSKMSRKSEKNKEVQLFYEYLNNNTDNVYLIPIADLGDYPSLRESYEIFEETKDDIFKNVVSMGGWTTKGPWLDDLYGNIGITNPLKQMTDDNVFIVAPYFYVEALKEYYCEHYYPASISFIGEKYDTPIYKIMRNDMHCIGENEELEISDINIDYDVIMKYMFYR